MSNELKRKLSQKEADALELETKLKEALKSALEQGVGLGLMSRTAVLTFLYALFPLQTDARREKALNSSLRQELERAKTKVEEASQLVRFAFFCLPAAFR